MIVMDFVGRQSDTGTLRDISSQIADAQTQSPPGSLTLDAQIPALFPALKQVIQLWPSPAELAAEGETGAIDVQA